jgi:hypothetical protein
MSPDDDLDEPLIPTTLNQMEPSVAFPTAKFNQFPNQPPPAYQARPPLASARLPPQPLAAAFRGSAPPMPMRPRLEKDLVAGVGRGQYQPPSSALPPPAYQQGPQPFYYGDTEYYEGYQPEPAYETPVVVAQGPAAAPDDEPSEFGGLVSYFSSQREDDLES